MSLPTTGSSVATEEVLAFQLAHAQARDAVHAPLHPGSVEHALKIALPQTSVVQLRSNAVDRASYLRNPGLGRTLHPESASRLQAGTYDLCIVLADGLSALALERYAVATLKSLVPQLEGWAVAPIALVEQGRVAIADPIGHALGAKMSLILIGERPGLSSPDSMGAYITWQPQPGRTDAERNCISNIRHGGLSPEQAAARLRWYLHTARGRALTGVSLKEEENLLA